ncbi:MAG: rod shape-determining protein MreC [Candidatus Paceibacterota bacterium]
MAIKDILSIFPQVKITNWQKIAIILGAFLVSDLVGLTQPITTIISSNLLPVRRVWIGGFNQVFGFWKDIQKLPKAVGRIQDLELRLAETSVSLAELASLRRENEELRFLFNNTDRTDERIVLTSPIIAFARPAIAAGSAEGVQLGSVVLSRDILLGQVSAVSVHEAQVSLLFATEARPVLAKTNSGTVGLIRGDGKKIIFDEVAKNAPLVVGEQIITAGQPQIEQNLSIGRITKIIDSPAASVKQAVVEQYVSFFEVPLVEIR